MQLLKNNTFMCTNSEITLDVISEVFTMFTMFRSYTSLTARWGHSE